MPKLKEFIEIDNISDLQGELRSLNDELMGALTQTNTVKELILQKNQITGKASQVSEMLIPEVRALNSFLVGELDKSLPEPKPEAPKVVRRGRPRKHPEIVKTAPVSPVKRKRGRPRKYPLPEPKPEKVLNKKELALEELKQNLAKLRDLK